VKLFAAALLLLAVGFANVSRGLDHPGHAYRNPALHNGSYSDLLALSGDRYLHGDHPVPYVDDRIEYPVILGFVIWLPSWSPGGQFAYLLLSALLLGACLLWSLESLRRIPGSNPWLLAATPAVALFGLLNWDLVGIAFMLAGIAAVDRDARSGTLIGLGVATKLFPIAAVPGLLRVVKRPVQWLGAAAAVLVVVNLPLAILAFDNWRWFFTFSSKRPPDFSLWNAMHITSIGLINAASLGALAAAALVALWHGRTAATGRLGTAFVIAVWMTINKVGSPQYALWVFAAAAMVGAPWSIFAGLVAASMFDFSLELWLMPHHAIALRPLVTLMVVFRCATTAWFAWWCWRRLRVEVASDEGAQRGGGLAGDRAGLADRLDLAR
jgi:hypothetical protein